MSFKKTENVILLLMTMIVCILAARTLSLPPISDFWEMFYSFHHLDDLPGGIKWLHILNFDPVEQVGFRPLAHMFYYIMHRVFGASFSYFNIINLVFYLMSTFLLYRFSLIFLDSRIMAALMTGIFSVLFTHFDIVLWSCHIHIMTGFGLFLAGFITLHVYLQTRRKRLLYLICILFLTGMFCYEPFFLWPMGSILFLYIARDNEQGRRISRASGKKVMLTVTAVYSLYAISYIAVKSLGTYQEPLKELSDFMRLSHILPAASLISFNLLYNNLILMAFPLLAFPLKITENIYLGGPLIQRLALGNRFIVYAASAAGIIALGAILMDLRRKRMTRELRILSLFLFLVISELFIVFFPRLASNLFSYPITEFRYQYIPNAFILLALFMYIERMKIPVMRFKAFVFPAIAVILLFNIFSINMLSRIYRENTASLGSMLEEIKDGIRKGAINPSKKLFIPDDLPEYLPSLSWNIGMGERFIKEGNYQWLFPVSQMANFASSRNEAHWIISSGSLIPVLNTDENRRMPGIKPVTFSGPWYTTRKDIQYYDLGILYKNMDDRGKAIHYLKKAVDFNPDNLRAQVMLAEIYSIDRKYDVSQKILLNMIEKIKDDDYLLGHTYKNLGHIMNCTKSYGTAPEFFMKAEKFIPEDPSIYEGLGISFMARGLLKEAEKNFKTSISKKPRENESYTNLLEIYYRTDQDKKFKDLLKKALLNNKKRKKLLSRIYLKMARYLDKKKERKRAIITLRKSLVNDPENLEALYFKGNMYVHTGKYDRAEKIFRSILDDPGTGTGVMSRTLAGMGRIYNEKESYEEAGRFFRKAINTAPKRHEPYHLMGLNYIDQERFHEAEVMLDHALKLAEDKKDIYNDMARLYVLTGRFKEAVDLRSKSAGEHEELEETLSRTYYNIALRLRNLENYKKALSYTERSLKNEPGYIRALFLKGEILQILGRTEEAEPLLDTVIERSEDRILAGRAYSTLGHIYNMRQEPEKALELFNKASELAPGIPSIYDGLGTSYANLGMYKEAENILRACLKKIPDDGYSKAFIYNSLARTYIRQDKYGKAVQSLKKSLDHEPDDPQTYSILARCYRSMGKDKKAEEMDRIRKEKEDEE